MRDRRDSGTGRRLVLSARLPVAVRRRSAVEGEPDLLAERADAVLAPAASVARSQRLTPHPSLPSVSHKIYITWRTDSLRPPTPASNTGIGYAAAGFAADCVRKIDFSRKSLVTRSAEIKPGFTVASLDSPTVVG